MGGSVCCAASQPVHQSQKFGRGGQRLAAKTLEAEQKMTDPQIIHLLAVLVWTIVLSIGIFIITRR